MKTLYIALLTLVIWLFMLMAIVMLGMAIFGEPALFPAVFILSLPAAGAWYLRWKAKKDIVVKPQVTGGFLNESDKDDLAGMVAELTLEQMQKEGIRVGKKERALLDRWAGDIVRSPSREGDAPTPVCTDGLSWFESKRAEWRAEIADGVLDDSFDFSPAPDACAKCFKLAEAGPYTLDELPEPVKDTHDDCRCDVLPHI